jgi:hypothetical protein
VLHEDGHERGGADRADEQVVQDVGHCACEDEGVGASGRAERRGNDHVADETEAAAQDVAKCNDRRGAYYVAPGLGAGDAVTLIGSWRYWRALHVAAS